MIKRDQKPDFPGTLKKGGYRATQGRLRLLETLWKEGRPMAIASIKKKLGSLMDEATLYRALTALAGSGIVRRVDLRHSHAHYELNVGKHHHHIVCRQCGVLEDFSDSDCDSFSKRAIRTSGLFKSIDEHAIELFGVCNGCRAKNIL